MQIKKMICKTAAKIVKKAAVNASNSASFGGYNQPKEPEALKSFTSPDKRTIITEIATVRILMQKQ